MIINPNEPQKTPGPITDKYGYWPTKMVAAQWSRNKGALHFYRVWSNDQGETQSRALEEDEVPKARMNFLNQKLMDKLMDRWIPRLAAILRNPVHIRGDFGRILFFCDHHANEVSRIYWMKLDGKITEVRATARDEIEARIYAMQREAIAAELQARGIEMPPDENENNAGDDASSGSIIPVTLEDFSAMGHTLPKDPEERR